MSAEGADAFIFITAIIGMIFAWFQYKLVARVSLTGGSDTLSNSGLDTSKLIGIYDAIREGADSFLRAEYTICAYFIASFGVVVLLMTSYVEKKFQIDQGGLTAISFVAGGITSIVSGLIGMKVAVFANARTTVMAAGPNPWTDAFNTAFRAGSVMGFSLCGLSMLVLYVLAHLFAVHFKDWKTIIIDDADCSDGCAHKDALHLMEALAGYGLGGSSIALFGRVGGGIYTKAADVGADLAGKVVAGIPEDDPRNPATIADNVGDNVGDVAGMGSDLFGSFAEATCAALVVASQSAELIHYGGWAGLMFPVAISGGGILVCIICSFLATHIQPVKKESDIEKVLKVQLGATTIMLTGVVYILAYLFLPSKFALKAVSGTVLTFTPTKAWGCTVAGLWSGCMIGFITEYYTSHSYKPVREVAQACETGAATNIIYGLALGYQSVILPVVIISGIIFLSFKLAGMYGVATAALGMLGTLATCLAIDVYGPIADNAGGIAEMCEMPSAVRDKTDALDAAGNTTAAIGKGFAIGSAALVSLALFGAFITRCSSNMPAGESLTVKGVNLLSPIVFASILFGAMVPYWFSALTMRSVGEAANTMVLEIARQFAESTGENSLGKVAGMDFEERQKYKAQLAKKGEKLVKPDYERCIAISTQASLREMIAPGCLVIVTPVLAGALFGVESVSGLLTGAIVSSVQLAISMSNTGGAWDNSKKYTEKGELNGYFPFRDGSPEFNEEQFRKVRVLCSCT